MVLKSEKKKIFIKGKGKQGQGLSKAAPFTVIPAVTSDFGMAAWVFSCVIFWSFVVSHFTSSLMVHFELIIVKNVRSVSRTDTGLDTPASFVEKRNIFAPLYCLCAFVKV